jgi:hypothetical protein
MNLISRDSLMSDQTVLLGENFPLTIGKIAVIGVSHQAVRHQANSIVDAVFKAVIKVIHELRKRIPRDPATTKAKPPAGSSKNIFRRLLGTRPVPKQPPGPTLAERVGTVSNMK